MSKASEYAEKHREMRQHLIDTRPTSLQVFSYDRAETNFFHVGDDGRLRIGLSNRPDMNAESALMLRDWLTEMFDEAKP